MKEYVEFRIPEKNARKHLAPDQGKILGPIQTVRKLIVDVEDPLYQKVGQLQSAYREEGSFFFLGWDIHRRYTPAELQTGKLFHLDIIAVFEPAGEECGTVYDETVACPVCQAGRKQVSDLVLDLRKLPRKDIARSIADEWIVSQRLAELLVDHHITGFALKPVRYRARYEDDPVDPRLVPSGQELLRQAEAAGVHFPDWDYWVWFNRPENHSLIEQVDNEFVEYSKSRDSKRKKPLPVWYQLEITSKPVSIAPKTQFGIAPFYKNLEDQYPCPFGHITGLNLLSEIWIEPGSWSGEDIVRTEKMVGVRRGLLVPTPLLLISPKLRELLESNQVKGYRVNLAHCD